MEDTNTIEGLLGDPEALFHALMEAYPAKNTEA